MKLSPPEVDPTRIFRPGTVARRFGVNASMVTHWMRDDQLDYVLIDGQRLIPEESIVVLERTRSLKGKESSGSVSLDADEHARHTALGENHWSTCGLCDDESPDA